MEKSRLIVVLIFVTAIPIIVSKNAKIGAINNLAEGLIIETNKNMRLGITKCLNSNLEIVSLERLNPTKEKFSSFLMNYRNFNSINIVNDKYEIELSAGEPLILGSYHWSFIKTALKSGKSSVFFTISDNSRVYAHMLQPYLERKTGKWKCVYATGDFTIELAQYTKPVKSPVHILKYIYDSSNHIILPSHSNMSLGVSLIKFIIRNINIGYVNKSKYRIARSKIKMDNLRTDLTGLHAITVLPATYINHVMIEYRIKTNAVLIIIFIVLSFLFADMYIGYSGMEKKLKMYKSIIQDSSVAIIVFNIKNLEVLESNKISKNVFYIEPGLNLKHFISKDEDRNYIAKIIESIGVLYNYKVFIRAKFNEEIPVILSLNVNYEKKEAIITFFEENACINKEILSETNKLSESKDNKAEDNKEEDKEYDQLITNNKVIYTKNDTNTATIQKAINEEAIKENQKDKTIKESPNRTGWESLESEINKNDWK